MNKERKIIKIKVKAVNTEPEKLFIATDFIKLDSALKLCGIAQTGGHAKILITDGEIRVNGDVCTERGKKLRQGDIFKYGRSAFEIINE